MPDFFAGGPVFSSLPDMAVDATFGMNRDGRGELKEMRRFVIKRALFFQRFSERLDRRDEFRLFVFLGLIMRR
jgi:hypothetical protein